MSMYFDANKSNCGDHSTDNFRCIPVMKLELSSSFLQLFMSQSQPLKSGFTFMYNGWPLFFMSKYWQSSLFAQHLWHIFIRTCSKCCWMGFSWFDHYCDCLCGSWHSLLLTVFNCCISCGQLVCIKYCLPIILHHESIVLKGTANFSYHFHCKMFPLNLSYLYSWAQLPV